MTLTSVTLIMTSGIGVSANLSNYADDNQIYFNDRDPKVAKSVINSDLAVASRWFDDNKLVLNPEKCKCAVLFFQKTILVIFPLALVM